MKLLVQQLTVTVVPFIAFFIMVIVTGESSHKGKALRLRIGRSALRSFAAAAHQRWL